VRYDITVNVTVDYRNSKDGKPKITSTAKLKERTFIDELRDGFDELVESVKKFEKGAGTESEGGSHGNLTDDEGVSWGKPGEGDGDGGGVPDMDDKKKGAAKEEKDKDGFTKLDDGTYRKDYDEGFIYKDKKGDTSVFWNRYESSSWKSATPEKKEEIKKWTPNVED
jgi:hypothetical protein